MAAGPADAAQHRGQVGAEVGQHGHNAAQLDHGRHRYARITPTQEHRHHLEMGRAANWQKLGKPLHHPQHQRAKAGFPKANFRGGQQRYFCKGNHHKPERLGGPYGLSLPPAP